MRKAARLTAGSRAGSLPDVTQRAVEAGRPRLALTVGDPAGIGPEVVLKALARRDLPPAALVVYGPLSVLLDRALRFGLRTPEELGARVVDVPLTGALRLGETSAVGGA